MGDFTRDLMDTVVAVTGASSGIGLASARMLVEGGARLAVQRAAASDWISLLTNSARTRSSVFLAM